jgi:hypothetical protein
MQTLTVLPSLSLRLPWRFITGKPAILAPDSEATSHLPSRPSFLLGVCQCGRGASF